MRAATLTVLLVLSTLPALPTASAAGIDCTPQVTINFGWVWDCIPEGRAADTCEPSIEDLLSRPVGVVVDCLPP